MAYVHYPDRASRNALIRQLSEEGLSLRKIAAEVGCNPSTVHEVLNPDKRRRYNARRRRYIAERTAS